MFFIGPLQTPSGRPREERLKPIGKMLSELWPLPIKKKKVTTFPPAHHCTSREKLQWVKDRDPDYHPRRVGPKLAESPKKQRGRLPAPKKFVLPTPQKIIKPSWFFECVLCDFTYKTSVLSGHFTPKENRNWVQCRGCKAYMHYTCIKEKFRCNCGVAHLLGRTKMQ